MHFGNLLNTLIGVPFLLVTASVGASAANQVTRNTCTDPLSCYLASIVIAVPDTCQMVNNKELCITNFVCQGINLDAIPSEYQAPTTVNLGAEGLGTACQGDYSYGKLVSGTATAAINQTDFDAGLFVNKSGIYPISTSFSSCEITSMYVHVTFTGGLLDSMASALEKVIAAAFQKLLCEKIPAFLATNVTNAIVNELDPMLQYVIASQPSPLPAYNSHYTAWGDSLVSKVKKIVSRLEGRADLKDFLLCMLSTTSISDEDLKKGMLGEIQNLFLSPGSYSYGTDSTDPDTTNTDTNTNDHYTFNLNEDIVLLHKAIPKGYNTTISLTSLRLRGLSSVNELDLLTPVVSSNATLRTQVGFAELTIELGLEVDIVPTTTTTSISTTGTNTHTTNTRNVHGPRDSYTEKLQVTLSMANVSMFMDLVLEVNAFVLKSYYLDQLSSKGCWLSAIEHLSIADLQLHTTITTLQAVQVVGSAGALESDILSLVNNAIAMVVSPQGFGELTTELINGLMQGPVRTTFNANAAARLADNKKAYPCLTHYPYNDHPDFVVWANSTLITTLDYVVNDLLGYQGLNKMMTCATNNTGILYLNTSRLSISVGGLNSFYALKVLSPVARAVTNMLGTSGSGMNSIASMGSSVATVGSAISSVLGGSSSDSVLYELESLVSMGYCPYSGSPDCNPLELVVAFNPKGVSTTTTATHTTAPTTTPTSSSTDTPITLSTNKLTNAMLQTAAAFNFAVSLSNFSVYLNTELKLDKDGLRDTQYKQLSTAGCIGQSFDTIAIEQCRMTVADAELTANDGSESRNITRIVRKVLGALTREDKLAQRNSDIAYKLSIAEETCANNGVAPHVNPTDSTGSGGDNLNWQWELFILVVGCLTALILLMAAYHYWGRSGKHYCSGEFLEVQTEEEEGMPLLTRLYHRWDYKNALLFHAHIPLWIRIAVPLCVLGDVAMFIQSNMDPRAVSVMVKIVMKTQTIDVGSVFDFGLKSTVVDMWNAGVYPLAVLILFFSGAWPYVKLLSMLTAWLAPPKLLSIERRETVLTVLDVLGKWSLIDFFVMILMLCAFYFNIYIGANTIEVTVLPRWGFYSFLLATMISLGLGHIILACHRLIIEPKVLPIPDDYCPRESLCSMVYEIQLSDRDVAFLCEQGVKSSGSVVSGSVRDSSGSVANNAASEGELTTHLLAPASPDEEVNQEVSLYTSTTTTTNNNTTPTNTNNTTPTNTTPTNNNATPTINNTALANEAAIAAAQHNYLQFLLGEQTIVPTERPDAALHKVHGTTMLIKVTTRGTVTVVFLLALTALFVVAGTFVLSMQFQFKGLVGLILFDRADVDYSFVTVGTSIPEHSGVPNDFATRWLQASLFLFGQAMPFAVLLTMTILWLTPMTLAVQRSVFVLAEVLNAWSALDVFCIAIAAALLEIQQFAAFIVGDSCDGINVILAEYMDTQLEGDDKCFDVVAQLDENSWLLFMAAALLLIVVLPLLQICHHALHLRLKLSTQASLVLHHMTHGTRPDTIREALRSLSAEKEQESTKEKGYGEFGGEYGSSGSVGGVWGGGGALVTPLLGGVSSSSGGGANVSVSPFHSVAPSAPATVTSSTAASGSGGSGSGSVEGDGTGSGAGSGRDSASSAASNTPSNTTSTPAEPSWWARCTTHNFNVTSMHYLSKMGMVELQYTPTVVVDDNVVLSTTNSYAIYTD